MEKDAKFYTFEYPYVVFKDSLNDVANLIGYEIPLNLKTKIVEDRSYVIQRKAEMENEA